MSDMIAAAKIRVFLDTDQQPAPEAPTLRFLRWNLVPLPAADHEAREPAGPVEPEPGRRTRTTP